MAQDDSYLLAFETSCDETSVAVLRGTEILSNVVYTQTVHEKYGGVVPEIASRAHMEKIVPVYLSALEEADITLSDISAIAYTQSPGLIGSLLVGATFAKTLAQSSSLPLIEINHIEAHAIANGINNPHLTLPFLCLIVSGGHTEFRVCRSMTETQVIGRTIDDAAGEAFDKIAKLLNLPYPGGPQIDTLARQGDPDRFPFPISSVPDLNFSFSGIKTSVLQFLSRETQKNSDFISENIEDICASVQKTIIDTLLQKFEKAIAETNIKEISLAGGVSANSGLRKEFLQMAKRLGCHAHVPDFEYCTDNAGLIAYAAYHRWKAGLYGHGYDLVPSARS